MKIKQLLVFWVFASCLMQPAFGTRLYGTRDCGQWINRQKNDYAELAIGAWLTGYMSGLSSMHALSGRKDDPLKKTSSADQIYLWMDNYCRKNPLSDISEGGDELFFELIQKQ